MKERGTSSLRSLHTAPGEPTFGASRQTAPRCLSEVYAGIARSMVVRGSVTRTQARVVDLAVEVIDGCDDADLMVPDLDDRLRTVAVASPVVRIAELARGRDSTGPARAASSCACPLATDRRPLGVLTLYSTRALTFTPDLLARARAFSAHAALAIDNVMMESELFATLMQEQTTGEAVGLLMARHGLSTEQARARLAELAQRLDVTELEAAAALVRGSAALLRPDGTRLLDGPLSGELHDAHPTVVSA